MMLKIFFIKNNYLIMVSFFMNISYFKRSWIRPQVTSEKICTNSSQPKHNNSDGTPICLDNDDIVKLKNFSDGRQSFRIMGDGKKGESLFYNTQNSDGKRLVSTETNDHDDWKLTWAKTYDNPSSSTLTNTTWSQNIV